MAARWAVGGVNSPFWHVPRTGAANPDLTGLAGITAFTVLFRVTGFVGFRRRDLAC